ncbi:glycoside hydrolase family 13 protein [Spelaeicoccus albus]|uniref:Alpha-glucosidase n=1 Tax=Spelaeicoccus albus TaxID=1280376 RepID=A0A7Z0AA69_9MICO|nr:alpha-amylase family glycosyl hydrolase [Spelaeicoccus albus]NYI66421.1 alpha-glucosidase [Spelaeicoccus albus]
MRTTSTQPSTAAAAQPAGDGATWWRQAAVYQIYPRSFADTDGNEIGDLKGITSRVPYLKSLGIDAVWLSPFYPSALADGGYDVDDYRDVDPKIGTLADFDAMSAALHEAGLKLIVDIVPNHTSDRHEWFREALASPKGSPARDRYIFRDGAGSDGSLPPTDWEANFGGSAWQRVDDGQWYLHLFAPEQPDLNWNNREVCDDFLTTLRFWSDRGVDGFRVDVAHGLAKDLSDPLPTKAMLDESNDRHDGSNALWDRDDVHEIYAEWRKVFNEYDPPRTAVAEAWVHADRRARYASPDGLGQAFNFDLLEAEWSPDEFRTIITKNLAEARDSGASSTWVLSNHDVVRHATRYGLTSVAGDHGDPRERGKQWLLGGDDAPTLDGALGLRRARAATLLMLALPGSAYIYQGEELGLQEVGEIPDDARADPVFFRSRGAEKGRDGCRVPLPWTRDGRAFGFSDTGAHLPQPSWFGAYSVEAEESDLESTLALYRRALNLRHRLQTDETLNWVDDAPEVVHFTRPGGWRCVTNFGSEPITLPGGDVAVVSGPLRAGMLPPDTTAWLA